MVVKVIVHPSENIQTPLKLSPISPWNHPIKIIKLTYFDEFCYLSTLKVFMTCHYLIDCYRKSKVSFVDTIGGQKSMKMDHYSYHKLSTCQDDPTHTNTIIHHSPNNHSLDTTLCNFVI